MRIRTGHGPNDWSLNVPSEPLSPKHVRGSLIQGDPGVVEKTRIHAGIQRAAARAEKKAGPPPEPKEMGRPRLSPDVDLIGRGKRPGYPSEEERIAARRKAWRESEQRKRQTQRDHRSKLRAEVEMMRLERAS